MRLKASHVLLIITFCTWIIIRCIPLAIFPGLYGFDPWYHLSVILGIQSINRIPEVSPFFARYYDHPGMHIFSLLIHDLTGLSLTVCLQIYVITLAIMTFITFYVFFRYLLGLDWIAMISVIILALSSDFLAQTNSAIPEFLALVFLPLGWFIILKIVQNSKNKMALGAALVVITLILYLSHNWTSLIFALGCATIFAAMLIVRPKNMLTGSFATLFPAFLIAIFLVLFDPWSANLFVENLLLIAVIGCFVLGALSILALKGPEFLQSILVLRDKVSVKSLIISGPIISSLIFLIVLVFYPVSRSLLWIFWRFFPFTIFIGLAILSLNIIPSKKGPKSVVEIFIICWIIFLGLLFAGGYLLTLVDTSSWQQLTIEATLTHRLLNYLTIAIIPLVTIAISFILLPKLKHKSMSKFDCKKTLLLGLISLMGISLVISSYNVYFPLDGWHQNWFYQSEIQAAEWLSEVRGTTSTTYTDTRLEWLIIGSIPRISSNHTTDLINLSYLNQTDWIPQTEGNTYYFITDILESAFMIDYSLPPIHVDIRTNFNSNPRLARCFSSNLVTIYSSG